MPHQLIEVTGALPGVQPGVHHHLQHPDVPRAPRPAVMAGGPVSSMYRLRSRFTSWLCLTQYYTIFRITKNV